MQLSTFAWGMAGAWGPMVQAVFSQDGSERFCLFYCLRMQHLVFTQVKKPLTICFTIRFLAPARFCREWVLETPNPISSLDFLHTHTMLSNGSVLINHFPLKQTSSHKTFASNHFQTNSASIAIHFSSTKIDRPPFHQQNAELYQQQLILRWRPLGILLCQ